MLNLTVRPGEYIQIGDDIRLVFLGGSSNNMKVMVDAPRKYNVARSAVLERNAGSDTERQAMPRFYREAPFPEELVQKIKRNARQKQG